VRPHQVYLQILSGCSRFGNVYLAAWLSAWRGPLSRLMDALGMLRTVCLSANPHVRATQDLTDRAKDSLVSFGERLSTRIFAAMLNARVRHRRACHQRDLSMHASPMPWLGGVCHPAGSIYAWRGRQGVAAVQHDAFDIGVFTSDCFQNADVDYALTLPAVRRALTRSPGAPHAIPIVTGFLGRGQVGGSGQCVAQIQARKRCSFGTTAFCILIPLLF
jgi:hypothetical protein